MANEVLASNKIAAREQCGIDAFDNNYSVHHIIEKRYYKEGKIPITFPINARSNLIPLPREIHRQLHIKIDGDIRFKNDINTHTYMANMAFNGELDLIPEGFYRTHIPILTPERKVRKRKKKKR